MLLEPSTDGTDTRTTYFSPSTAAAAPGSTDTTLLWYGGGAQDGPATCYLGRTSAGDDPVPSFSLRAAMILGQVASLTTLSARVTEMEGFISTLTSRYAAGDKARRSELFGPALLYGPMQNRTILNIRTERPPVFQLVTASDLTQFIGAEVLMAQVGTLGPDLDFTAARAALAANQAKLFRALNRPTMMNINQNGGFTIALRLRAFATAGGAAAYVEQFTSFFGCAYRGARYVDFGFDHRSASPGIAFKFSGTEIYNFGINTAAELEVSLCQETHARGSALSKRILFLFYSELNPSSLSQHLFH